MSVRAADFSCPHPTRDVRSLQEPVYVAGPGPTSFPWAQRLTLRLRCQQIPLGEKRPLKRPPSHFLPVSYFGPSGPGHLDSARIPATVVPTSVCIFYIFTRRMEASLLRPKEGEFTCQCQVWCPRRVMGMCDFRLFPSPIHVLSCVRFPSMPTGLHGSFYGREIPAGCI